MYHYNEKNPDLLFYYFLKVTVSRILRVLDLEAKRHKFSSTLSGGQKRKLSVGIALIAGSKVMRLITLELFRQCGSLPKFTLDLVGFVLLCIFV
jgi:ABC-type histidine transport system ATPase subunit